MDFILPAFVTLATVFVRWAIKQFGKEVGWAFVLVLAFLLSGAVAFIYSSISPSFWENLVKIFSLQMALYEVFWKRVLSPILGKLGL